jgi:hypothetical protein
MAEPSLPELVRMFVAGARSSPLYQRLGAALAEQPDTLALLNEAPPTQRHPVLLFAAIHDLLLQGAHHELAGWYPSVTGQSVPDDDPAVALSSFARNYRDEIVAIVRTRSTQTNEVGRVGPLGAALATIERPLALLELGCSAGLNLLVERYRREYLVDGSVVAASGPADAAVVVRTDCSRGAPSHVGPVDIVERLGIDLNPIDVSDDAEAAWLEACVWPDEMARVARLRNALTVARSAPPNLITGDLIETFESAAGSMTTGHLCLMHSWVFSYLTETQRAAFVDRVDQLGAQRDLDWVIFEQPSAANGLPFPGQPDPSHTALVRVSYRSGRREDELLATCHPHGAWMHWVSR